MKLRQFRWVSSVGNRHSADLKRLQDRMEKYYSFSPQYYTDIDFNSGIWLDTNALPERDILKEVEMHTNVLEVGCGKAGILSGRPHLENRYHGLDFSDRLMAENQERFPSATFQSIQDTNRFDFPNGYFDLIFSHFVIEHTVYPAVFLNECLRMLKNGGMLIVMFPDFMNFKFLPSQRLGLSSGSGRDKLAKGKYIDALVTAFDSKVRLSLFFSLFRMVAKLSPRFYINLNPVCFYDEFIPDVDAVYLANHHEVRSFCKSQIVWIDNDKPMDHFLNARRLAYLKGIKKQP